MVLPVKIKAVFFIVLVVTSVFVATFPAPVNADSSYHDGVNNKYYSAIFLRDCIANLNNRKTLTIDDEADGILEDRGLYADASVNIGRWLDPDDGNWSCGNQSEVGKAAKNLGFDDVYKYLEKIGYKKNGNTYTISGADSGNSQIVKQTDASKYYAYDKILSKQCSPNIPPGSKDDTATLKSIYKDGDTYKVKDIKIGFTNSSSDGSNGGIASGVNSGGSKNIVNYDYNGKTTTCSGLVKSLNSLSGAATEWMNSNKSNGFETSTTGSASGTTKSDCEKNGGTWNADKSTCDNEGKNTCAIEGGLGWIICPIMTSVADVNDAIFGFISDNFLTIDSKTVTKTDSSGKESTMYKTWKSFRNIANVLFVAVFLFVIYSQMTGGGK